MTTASVDRDQQDRETGYYIDQGSKQIGANEAVEKRRGMVGHVFAVHLLNHTVEFEGRDARTAK